MTGYLKAQFVSESAEHFLHTAGKEGTTQPLFSVGGEDRFKRSDDLCFRVLDFRHGLLRRRLHFSRSSGAGLLNRCPFFLGSDSPKA